LPPIVGAGFLGIEHFTPPWDIFYLPLFNLLLAFYHLIVNDFALAIIVFTVVIRTLLAPLFVRQIRSQKEMQQMQPLVREIQRKHKGNRQKIGEETMALYREHGVNQFGGCLPVILQLPLLFALYQALIRASNVVTLTAEQASSDAFAQLQASLPGITPVIGEANKFNAPISGACDLAQFQIGEYSHFLPLNCQLIDPIKLSEQVHTTVPWLFGLDLAKIDHVFAIGIPGVGFALSGLALIAAVLQFVQVRMTSPRPNPDDPTSSTTSTMTYLFPLLTIFWGGLFPSGLILYWIIYTGYLVVQQYTIMGWGNLFPLFGWQPRWAPPTEPPPPPKRIVQRDESTDDRTDATDRPQGTRTQSPNQRSGGARGGNRQQPRSGKKRRGRKR
jgi:YidC/Oxa1 family membrane protein insertase